MRKSPLARETKMSMPGLFLSVAQDPCERGQGVETHPVQKSGRPATLRDCNAQRTRRCAVKSDLAGRAICAT